MPSASPQLSRLGVAALCAALGAGALAGCTTTQEKAARQQAEAKRILEARQQPKKKGRDGTKASKSGTDSAHRPQKEGEK